MKKILTVLGARPQFIKASAVSRVIAATPGLSEILVHTGQHFDANMSDVFFSELNLATPDYLLNIHGVMHGAMTGRMLEGVERILIKERPDFVLVYGDTNSTLAGALAAVKLHIPVAHVEAGLRSFNMAMPEEVNRILTDQISAKLFTPSKPAFLNLKREGCADEKIIEVGDVMYDVALHHGTLVKSNIGLMQDLGLTEKNYILATIHRAENTDDIKRLTVIVDALSDVASQVPVVWPLHPRTRNILNKNGLFESLAKKIKIIEPVGYLDMVQLEKYAALIATDSGGVQKEAFFYQVPCVTLRNETEWSELVEFGWNRLAPPINVDTLKAAIKSSLGSHGLIVQPYGAGNAAQLIVEHLMVD